jgi:iron complex outermembrane receptor protein
MHAKPRARALFRRPGLPLAVLAAGLIASESQAQQREPMLEEIVVTARQRNESLLDIPLSITALSSQQIDDLQLTEISDITRFTPGFDYRTQNTQNGARILPNFRFRGMNSGFSGSSNQLGAIFVDGLYLFGGAQSLTFEDVERIEVIKGPQSAYFGRSTFGGAVNFITREPGEEFGGRVSASLETYESYSISMSAEGPITEKVRFRISGTEQQNGAHYKASDGGEIGREKTDSINTQLLFLPTDNLKIRVRYNRSQDNDSVPATVSLNASRPDINSPKECTTGTLPFWCGELPKLGDQGVPPSVIDVPTTFITPAFARSNSPNIISDILNNNKSNPLTATDFLLHDKMPNLSHMGLARKLTWLSVGADYEFGDGYTAHISGAKSRSAVLAAASLLPDGASASISPGLFKNWEVEGRLVSPQDQRFTWLVGANVFEQEDLGLPSSGFAARVNTLNQIVYSPPLSYASQTKVAYAGFFGGAHYDILDNLAIDVEARYQIDKLTNSYQSTAALKTKYTDFAPRVILTYKPMDDMTVYGSWARGVNPGFVNTAINLVSPALRTQILADPGYADSVSSETLDSYEIGVKQQGERFRYAVAAYYMKWHNLKNQVFFLCPGNVCGPNFIAFAVGFTTARSGTLKGIEAEGTLVLTENWDATLTFEKVNSKFDSFSSALAVAATGKTFANDVPILEYPQSSGSLTSSYRMQIASDYDWYMRGTVTYTGKSYSDEFAQSWIGDTFNVSLRTGIEGEGKRFEAYVTNLFNQRQWTSARRGSGVLDPRPQFATNLPTIFAIPPRKQAFGVRASYDF